MRSPHVTPWPPWRSQLLLLLLLLRPSAGLSFFGSSSEEETTPNPDDDGRVQLHVGGVFPMEAGAGGWPGGQACLPAVEMALEHINNNTDVLPGYKLHLHQSNSKCQPGLAMQELYNFVYEGKNKLMLLAGCSPVTTVVAETAPEWNLVVISYGASSPALSNRQRFPTLFRTHPSANMQNPTRVALFAHFKWTRISILQSVEEVFTYTAMNLEAACKKKGIRAERQSFYGDPTDAVRTLVRQDARIIVGLFYVTEARRVLCQAYKQGLYGRKYVWFFIGWYADTWYEPHPEEHLNCTKEEMRKAAEYHFTTESIMLSKDEVPGVSGITGLQFESMLRQRLNNTDVANLGGWPEAPLAYDALWALALAFNCTRSNLGPGYKLENFTYNNTVMAQLLFDCVKNTSFKGVSGNVMFSDSGDRIAKTQIEQLQDGKYVMVGRFDNGANEFNWTADVKWPDGRGPPTDSTIIKEHLETVSNGLYIMVCLLAILGIALSLICFIFNAKYGYRGVIVQSQPQCNNILLAGSALCSASLFLMGLPTAGVQLTDGEFTLLCHSRISILMIGFTFAYGSMFAKVWIVHRIGAAENQQIASRQKDEYKPLLGKMSEKEDASPWDGLRTLISTIAGRPLYVAGSLRKSSTPSYGSLLARSADRLGQPIPAVKFYGVIVAFLAIDILIILIWIWQDPLVKDKVDLPMIDQVIGDNDEDVKLKPFLEHCKSEHHTMWTSIIMGYKLIILIFGLFLAYETRNLKLRFVNDSRLVGLAIYNVVCLAVVTGPIVTYLIKSQINANFGMVSATVILCTYISLGLVFVPKLRFVLRVPASRDEAYPSANGPAPALSKAELKKLEQLTRENEALGKQIEEKDERISQCTARIEEVVRESSGGSRESDRLISVAMTTAPVELSKQPTDASFSSPTKMTTTALIELQPACHANETTGQYQYEEMDNSTSSDEILL
ncbi:hypothetical protein PMAYCL1PPCAC_32898 [Pristionchus mayeri]|uniref:G-protein coupled receptors family 3 profile domain-containing protein n=1 Tax=Pristionchus mayeri TaxID=1317129 RepID=A0AAN5DFK9_9BILA|nr:hypothetical protein PMAYCL1PPCAC_32898 [Pristionchus mayeri]